MHSQTSSRHLGPALLGFVLFVVGIAAALSLDVPRATFGIKSDEATYIAAGLSAAYDGDFAFEQRDLERFAGLYHTGPEGIFLKRGKVLRVAASASWPFVRLDKQEDPERHKLYFGKSLAYSLFAAPFVRLLGLNGFLVFHVVLFALTAAAMYLFLAAQSPPASAAVIVSAFLAASVVPVFGVILMPELFNITLVTLAYFCWLHKEVAPGSRWAGRWTDALAAVLLGICTYSKPLPTAVLVAPLVLLAWSRRQWLRGLAVGAIAVAVTALFFVFNAAVSGEFNYQGGDRKIFYARFPFDTPDFLWETRGGQVTTDTSTPQEVLTSSEAASRFSHNAFYFLVGRHYGFLPYFFPGVVAILWWLASPSRRVRWRQMVCGAAVVSALVLLILLPWTWSGDGGPPGNRYYLSAYPILLFLIPPEASLAPALLAWVGGALFTAKMVLNPFVTAKNTYIAVEKGPLRRLPVELTMANTLPLRLAQPLRGRVLYGRDPWMFLYFLDQNAWPPEPNGMWVSGSGRADVIVRTAAPFSRMDFEAESPIRTVVTLSLGAGPVTVTVEPGTVSRFSLQASGVHGLGDYNYLLSVRSTEAFVPHLREPENMDYRNLSVQLRFVPQMDPTPPPR